MKTYVFFNRNTGQIVHTHTEVAVTGEATPLSREELLSMDLRQPEEERIDPNDLDVLESDLSGYRAQRSSSPEEARKELYVDVQKRVVAERDVQQE
jgi:hypothetical protein